MPGKQTPAPAARAALRGTLRRTIASAVAAAALAVTALLFPGAARSAAIPGDAPEAVAAAAAGHPLPKNCKAIPRFHSVDAARDARRRGTFATRLAGWSKDVYVSVPLAPAPPGGWPLIVALWGTGSSGERMCTMIGLSTLAYDLKAVLVGPSQDGDYRNRADVSAASIAYEAALERFPIDRTRATIFGSSLGGWEVWRTLSENPEPWAAAAIYAGAPPALWVDRMLRHSTPPLYMYVGERDPERREGMRNAYEKFFELGREVEFHVMPGWEHGPAFTLQREEYLSRVFPFLLAHRLLPPAKS
ncbi:MAG TPA: hypothetical protein VG389_02840 [Myxococcota bacterium]|nr:hypothetical protein [Myxococcota bacterium]